MGVLHHLPFFCNFFQLQKFPQSSVISGTFRSDAEHYAPSTAVFVTEILKLSLCTAAVARKSTRDLLLTVVQIRNQQLLYLPALLYVVQSNLLFFSSERLPPIIYIVCTQMKIFTSAVFSFFILGKRLNTSQHMCLMFLVLGIVLVQADGG